MLWAILSILSGFSAVTSDALLKKHLARANTMLVVWSRFAFASLFLLLLLPFVEIPKLDATFWGIALVLVPLEIAALFLYVKAVQQSPLSLTLPFLAFTPLFLIPISFILLGELPTMIGMLGIVLIVAGSYVLNFSQIGKGIFEPFKTLFRNKGSLMMVAVAFIYSITSAISKIAVQRSNAVFFSVFYTILILIALSIFIFNELIRNFKGIKTNIEGFAFSGFFYGLMILFHFVALSLIIVPYMIALKRTSSIFGVAYGWLMFKERKIAERMIGALIMVLGVILILLF